MIRTFIAIPLPEDLHRTLQTMILALRRTNPNVRWVNPQQAHITLKFLGNISGDLVKPVCENLDAIARRHAPLHLSIGPVNASPSINRPRVIWMPLRGQTGELSDLAKEIDQGCVSLGMKKEKRQFSAHITLGRLKNPSVVDLRVTTLEKAFTSNEVIFYKSELTRKGAIHTVIHKSLIKKRG
ncbi:MAG: RNA 2',3'-cyclic phosphodiesterase [Thermodesulfobacteriota bacterium]|nr:RNA 2',3'-cyclic phosphodiesterase [Thermodesulfobacteriota bacterium]